MALSITSSQIVAAAASTSNLWSGEALTFLSTLRENATGLVDVSLPNVPDDIPSTPFDSVLFAAIGGAPVRSGSTTFNAGSTEPGTLATTAISTPESVAIPGYDIATPSISLPVRPQLTSPTAPTAPAVEEAVIPVSPTIELPTAPTLGSVSFPDAPTLSLPTFAEVAPISPNDFISTATFSYQDDEFPTPLLDAVRGKLLTDVTDGGYGIDSVDEDALWARTRDREIRQLGAAETAATELYANKGYSLPPGALSHALLTARVEADRNVSETNREISVKRADLFRDSRQFSLQQGLAVENTRLQHFGFKMERALNAQRFTAEFVISVHDARIRLYNAQLQGYSTEAEVYRTQLQAAVVQVQIFEAQIRAAVAQQEASRTEVELYQALLQAATTRVNLFEAQMQAASLFVEIQRSRVEAFRAEVQAFTAQVQGNQAQLDLYRAGISGEQAKIEIFSTEVGAYSTRVQAAATDQAARNSRVDIALRTKQAEIAQYGAAIERYKTNLAAETSRVDSILRTFGADTDVYRAALAGYESLARVALQEDVAQIQAISQQTERLQTNAQLEIQQAQITLQERFKAADAGAELATGIVTAVNSTVQALTVETDSTSFSNI